MLKKKEKDFVNNETTISLYNTSKTFLLWWSSVFFKKTIKQHLSLTTDLTMTLLNMPALQAKTRPHACWLKKSEYIWCTHCSIVSSQDWRYATFYLHDLLEDHTYIL